MTDTPATDPWSISDPWSSGAPATPNPNCKTRIIKPIGSPEGEQYTRKGKLISAAWVNQTGPNAGRGLQVIIAETNPQGETYIYDDFFLSHYATEEGGYYGDELPILIKDTPDGEIHTERTGRVYNDRYNMTRNTTYNLTITVPPHRIHKLGKIL